MLKVTPSYLHRKQLSADRAAHTELKEALSHTSVGRKLTPSARGGETESTSPLTRLPFPLPQVHVIHFFDASLHDDMTMLAASPKSPDVSNRTLIL